MQLLKSLFQKKTKKPFVSAVVAAGGSSSRMGGENKLLCEVGGIPVLIRTLLAFEACPVIDEIILVARGDAVVEYSQLCSDFAVKKLSKVVAGGSSRTESVFRGLTEVSSECRFACVHDAARPLIEPADIERVCKEAFEHDCAIAATPMTDTVKQVTDGNRVARTIDRSSLVRAQTPQCADVQLLRAAVQGALQSGEAVTDECAALERLGMFPHIVICSPSNIKITTPEDLFMAEGILEARK